MVSFNDLFTFVLIISRKYNIDSSHSEQHSMDVLHFADENYKSQLKDFPYLEKQKTEYNNIKELTHDKLY